MPRPSTPSCAWNQHLRHGCVQAAKRLQWGKVMRRRDRPSPHPRRTSVSLGAPVTISDLQRLATAKASSVGSNGWLPFVRQQSASATLSLLRTVVLALNPAPAIMKGRVPRVKDRSWDCRYCKPSGGPSAPGRRGFSALFRPSDVITGPRKSAVFLCCWPLRPS